MTMNDRYNNNNEDLLFIITWSAAEDSENSPCSMIPPWAWLSVTTITISKCKKAITVTLTATALTDVT